MLSITNYYINANKNCNKVSPHTSQNGHHFFLFSFRAVHAAYIGVESDQQLLTYAAATAIRDSSCVCNIHHSPQQCWIPDPLNQSRDQTHILLDISQICFHCATTGTPEYPSFKSLQINTGEGVEKKRTLLQYQWECKLVLSLWRTMWRFLKKLKIELAYDPAVPLLDIFPEKTII